jgi:hypothetical protein
VRVGNQEAIATKVREVDRSIVADLHVGRQRILDSRSGVRWVFSAPDSRQQKEDTPPA